MIKCAGLCARLAGCRIVPMRSGRDSGTATASSHVRQADEGANPMHPCVTYARQERHKTYQALPIRVVHETCVWGRMVQAHCLEGPQARPSVGPPVHDTMRERCGRACWLLLC